MMSVTTLAPLLVAMLCRSALAVDELTVVGRVTDGGGRPVSGARVIFMPDEEVQIELGLRGTFDAAAHAEALKDISLENLPDTRTDEDGRFEVTGPWFGRRFVSNGLDDVIPAPGLMIDAPGFAIESVPCLDPDGSTHDVGTLRLTPGAMLEGRVLGPRGNPREGARVHAEVARDAHWTLGPRLHAALRWRTTDAEGRFAFDTLPSGKATVTITSPTEVALTTIEQALEAGQRVDLGTLRLQPGDSLRGRVVNQQGDAVPGAAVHATYRAPYRVSREDDLVGDVHRAARPWTQGRHAVTDADGLFELRGMETARPWLWVAASGYELLGLSAEQWARQNDKCVLVLSPQATVRVAVVNAHGESVPDPQVVVFRLDGLTLPPDIAPLLVQGKTTIAHPDRPGESLPATVYGPIGPGGTGVLARAADGLAWVDILVGGASPGEHLDTVVTLPPGSILSGRVVDQQGGPMPGVLVDAQDWRHALDAPLDGLPSWRTDIESPSSRRTWTNEDGLFELRDLQPGRWQVSARALDAADWDRHEVTIRRPSAKRRLNFQLTRAATVTGRLSVEGKDPRAREIFVGGPDVIDKFYAHKADGYTDAAGRFTLHGVPPGAWTVWSDLGGSVQIDVVGGQVVEVMLDVDVEAQQAYAVAEAARQSERDARDDAFEEAIAAERIAEQAAFLQATDFPATMPFESGSFPTMEPFGSNPMLELLMGDALKTDDLLAYALFMNAAWTEEDQALLEEDGVPPGLDGLDAGDRDAMTIGRRLAEVPILIGLLENAWSLKRWEPLHVDVAQQVALYMSRLPESLGSPDVVFTVDEHAANHQSLETLAVWYTNKVRRPAIYASMLALVEFMEDGPWAGTRLDENPPIVVSETLALDDRLTLVLGHTTEETDQPLLQCQANGQAVWTTRMDHTGSSLGFTDHVEQLGPYGWRVTLSFGERCTAYLDAEGRLLFYFTSW